MLNIMEKLNTISYCLPKNILFTGFPTMFPASYIRKNHEWSGKKSSCLSICLWNHTFR